MAYGNKIPWHWGYKPPLGSRLDRQHPISQGLLALGLLNEGTGLPVELLTNTRATVLAGTPTWIATPFGNGVMCNGAVYGTGITQPALSAASGFTWRVRVLLSTNGSSNTAFGNRYNGVQSPLQFVKLDGNGAWEYYNGGNNLNYSTYNITPLGVWHEYVLVKSGSVFTTYLDGNAFNSATSSQSMGANPVNLGGDGNETGNYQFAAWSLHTRALSASEVASLYADPWQMIAPPPGWVYYSVPAGGGGSLSESATLAGTGGLSASPDVLTPAQTTQSGSGGLAGSPTVLAGQSATLSGAGTLTASPDVLEPGSVSLSGIGGVSGSPDVLTPGAATLSGAGSLSAGPDVLEPSSVVLAGAGSMSAAATVETSGNAATLAGLGSLSASPDVREPGAATETGTSALSASADVTSGQSASLTGAGSLSANPDVLTPAQATLGGSAALTAASDVLADGAAALTGAGTLSAAGQVQGTTLAESATLSGQGSLSAAPDVIVDGSVTMGGSGGVGTGTVRRRYYLLTGLRVYQP